MKTNKTLLTWNKNRDPATKRGKKTKNQSNFFHHLYSTFIFVKYKKKLSQLKFIVYRLKSIITMTNMLSFTIKFHLSYSWKLTIGIGSSYFVCRTVNKENWKIHFSLEHGSKRDRNGSPVPESAAQAQKYWICNHWETESRIFAQPPLLLYMTSVSWVLCRSSWRREVLIWEMSCLGAVSPPVHREGNGNVNRK